MKDAIEERVMQREVFESKSCSIRVHNTLRLLAKKKLTFNTKKAIREAMQGEVSTPKSVAMRWMFN